MAVIESIHLLYVVLLSLSGWYIYASVKSYLRLKHFPGPTLAAWSDLWYISKIPSGKSHLDLSDISTKYGLLARLGPNTLITADPDFFLKIHSKNTGYYKDDFYKAFRFGADDDNVFSAVDNNKHTHLRKRVAAGYSGKNNPDLEANIDAVIFSLIKSWKERYISVGGNTKPMDFARQMQYLTLDIITSLSFSQPFGWVETDTDLYEYVSIMAANFPIMYLSSAIPVVNDILRIPLVQRLLSPSVKDRVGMGKIKAVSRKIIAERFSEFNSEKRATIKNDMTTSFISNGLTEAEIADGALLAILAGSDTSASVIRSGLTFILTQPRIIRTLQAECDDAYIPHNHIISYARALELPYLQACVKEALRHWPAGTGLNPRIVPPEGDYYNGQFIPGGTRIGQCAWNLTRLNFKAYGPDANVFRPERWIDAAVAAKAGHPERLDAMEKAQDLVFSVGDFKCLGYRIALIEISKILFELVRRYDIGFLDGMKTMDSSMNYGLWIQEGMWVKVEER